MDDMLLRLQTWDGEHVSAAADPHHSFIDEVDPVVLTILSQTDGKTERRSVQRLCEI
jgi:hypothetical protein